MPFVVTNRAWLHAELGDRIRPDWNKTVHPGRWEIAKPHLRTLTEALAERFGEVNVYLEFSTTERCDRNCQRAEYDDCTCSCRGEYHGGGTFWTEWQLVGEDTLVGPVGRVVRHYIVRREDIGR
ncbi:MULTISPECIES: hypothetical protein [unclassified Streptomyces]|uniref:hypothetical protein n=1 Tax=unclassified Streptomyces TaxID=2593676 RepID=UPI002E2A14E6|nr:hypothetical protein [Streptomyces sp. NBC_00228]